MREVRISTFKLLARVHGCFIPSFLIHRMSAYALAEAIADIGLARLEGTELIFEVFDDWNYAYTTTADDYPELDEIRINRALRVEITRIHKLLRDKFK